MQAFGLANGTKGQTDWSKAKRVVRNLRQRIFRASQRWCTWFAWAGCGESRTPGSEGRRV